VLGVAGIGVEIARIRTEIAPGTAPRPLNGCLKSARVPPLPSWREGLAEFWASRPSEAG